MKKEYRIPYKDISDPQKITQYNKQKVFKEHDFDIHRHECDIEDDHDRQERIIHIQPEKKYFYR